MKRRWIALGLLFLGTVLVFALGGRLSEQAERLVLARLAERGLHLSYRSRGWLPWRGLTFREVALSDGADRSRPIISLTNLSAELSWSDLWQNRSLSSRWRTDSATLTLMDAHGPVSLERVTADVQVEAQNMTITTLEAHHGQVSLSLTGELSLASSQPNAPHSESPNAAPTRLTLPPLDFTTLRKTLDALDVQSQDDGLRLVGTVMLNFAAHPARWSVKLSGEGRALKWREVPIQQFSGKVAFSEKEFNGTMHAVLTGGKLIASLSQEQGEFLHFDGTATDATGAESEFTGLWNSSLRMVQISTVSGQADWLALTRNLPQVSAALPKGLVVDHFPALTAEKLVWRKGQKGESQWSVQSVRLDSPGAITVNVAGHPLALTGVRGTISHDGAAWHLREGRADVLGGALEASGQWAGDVFSKASLMGTHLQLTQMLPWLGNAENRMGGGEISFDYAGQLGASSVLATGRGSLRMDQAPLVEVPLLEPTYQFFSALLPATVRNSAGEMSATFTVERGVLRTNDFKAQSQALTVAGHGTIDLPRQSIEARARGDLRGVVGLATNPLTRAMEMKITGSLKNPTLTMPNPLQMAGGILLGTTETARQATQLPEKVLREGTSLPLRLWKSLSGSATPK